MTPKHPGRITTCFRIVLTLFTGLLVAACARQLVVDQSSNPETYDIKDLTTGVPTFGAAPEFDLNSALSNTTSGRTYLGDEPGQRRKMVSHRLPWAQRPTLEEEVWIIARDFDGPQLRADDDHGPGSGAMLACRADRQEQIPVPLKHTDVKASILGYLAAVDVTQQFHNPYDEKIEAVYVFPLPANAGVNEFVMTIGDRRIRGIIRERQEAEAIYKEARSQGHVASLLTQERPNVFTQRVANIEPGKAIDVSIRYYHTLAYDDGWYEWVFPMVVGPRYNPSHVTDGVGAVPRNAAGTSGQSTEVQYLRPNERSGHDIAVQVELSAGVEIQEIACPSHRIDTNRRDDYTAVSLRHDDTLPNKDFVLRFRVAGRRVQSSLVLQPGDDASGGGGGYFTLMLFPPGDLSELRREPMDMVFLLDTSGSMSGRPIEKVKDALKAALRAMDEKDYFWIVCFASEANTMSKKPLRATRENVAAAMRFVDTLNGNGGTEMLRGVQAALRGDEDSPRRRMVALLTDGYIGNESEIIATVAGDEARGVRFFSFGVGSSPNRHLIEGVAKAGQGAVAYIGSNTDAGKVTRKYLDRVSHPALSDLQIDWGGMRVSGVYPRRLPDLFVGRPVVLTGRYEGRPTGAIRVSGTAGGRFVTYDVPARLDARAPDDTRFAAGKALPSIWARARIADLTDQMIANASGTDPRKLAAGIRETALSYRLMSDFTAFVAVDASRQTAGHVGTTVPVPVPVPEGTRYDTTVGTP